MYFRNYRRPKTLLLKWLKYPVSELFSTVNILNCPKHCWKLNNSTFILFFDHSERNWVGKRVLVTSEILGLFANTLTADDMYCLHKWEKLPRLNRMQLSKKAIVFFSIFMLLIWNRSKIWQKTILTKKWAS